MKNTYKPNNAMKSACERGLKLRKEYGRGGTLVGVARARDITNDKMLPIETVARMYSFFKRHEVDKRASGWSEGEENYPSNGLIAWLLWGGDAGYKWSTSIWEKYKEENKSINDFNFYFDNIGQNDKDLTIKMFINMLSSKNED